MSEYDPSRSTWSPPGGASGIGAEQTSSADRWALIAVTTAAVIVLSMCVPGFSCLAPLIAGVIALTQAKNAVNPDRARTYGWIATGIGIAMLLVILGFIVLYGAAFMAMLSEM